MAKASVSPITVSLSFVLIPKALAMARLSAAAGLFAILPLSSSQFCPLAPWCYHPLPCWHPTAHHRLAPYCSSQAGPLLLLTGWHPTATHRLAPYCSTSLAGISCARWLRSRSTLPIGWPLLVTPSRGIVLPPWQLSNALNRCNDLPDRTSGFGGPSVGVFLCPRSTNLSPRAAFLAVRVFPFVLVSLRKGLGLSTCTFPCIVSLHV